MLEPAALGEAEQGLGLTEKKGGVGNEHPLCAEHGTTGFPLSSHIVFSPCEVEVAVPTFG